MSARTSVLAFATTASLLLSAPQAGAERHRRHERSTTISDDDRAGHLECRDVRVRFGDLEVARGEETRSIPQRQAPRLSIEAAKNGGIRVQGWDRPEYEVTACKAAGGDDDRDAEQALARISLRIENGTVSADGPGGEDWVVYLLIRAPRDAELSLVATNGPIGLVDLAGKVRARNQNGPISVRACPGDIDVATVNGPISLNEGGGKVSLSAQNGPISVALGSRRWEGQGLDAHTQNGPVTLKLPDDFESSVRVEAASHSPMTCRAAACRTARKDFDDDTRRIEFGGSNPTLRLSTVNGPVSIVSRGDS